MTEPLVIARLKATPNDQNPHFTRSGTVDELLASIEARIPVDIIYYLTPGPDGKSFALIEVGRLIVDIVPTEMHRERSQQKINDQSIPQPQPTGDSVQNSHIERSGKVEMASQYSFSGLGDIGEPIKPKAKRGFMAKLLRGGKDEPDQSGPMVKPGPSALMAKPGQMVTTGFIEATPEQAEAASEFKDNA